MKNHEVAEILSEILAGPYQQHVTQTSIIIMWETNEPAKATVEYGKSDKLPLENKISTEGTNTIHEVKISNLKPESPYYYRVVSFIGERKVSSDIYTFNTAVHHDTPFAFIVMGDNRIIVLKLLFKSKKFYIEEI